jgi:hypothetical protein
MLKLWRYKNVFHLEAFPKYEHITSVSQYPVPPVPYLTRELERDRRLEPIIDIRLHASVTLHPDMSATSFKLIFVSESRMSESGVRTNYPLSDNSSSEVTRLVLL